MGAFNLQCGAPTRKHFLSSLQYFAGDIATQQLPVSFQRILDQRQTVIACRNKLYDPAEELMRQRQEADHKQQQLDHEQAQQMLNEQQAQTHTHTAQQRQHQHFQQASEQAASFQELRHTEQP